MFYLECAASTQQHSGPRRHLTVEVAMETPEGGAALAALLEPLAVASEGSSSSRFLSSVHATLHFADGWQQQQEEEEQEEEQQQQQQQQEQSMDAAGIALAACADAVELEVRGDPQPLLSAIARIPDLAQRLSTLHLRRCWREAVVASLTALTGCSFAALQRVVLWQASRASAAPLLEALARLQAPRLRRLVLDIVGDQYLRLYGAEAADVAAAEAAAAAAAEPNCAVPGLLAALEALGSRQQPVDARGRPTQLELRLIGDPPAAALAATARSVVQRAGSQAAWLVVVEDA
jgi:hypothetical protein